MLVAMATGTGKTKLAIALLYRLLAAKRFRRVCFVVDRNALGTQRNDPVGLALPSLPKRVRVGCNGIEPGQRVPVEAPARF
jgi:type I site-specific restriction endonuclease